MDDALLLEVQQHFDELQQVVSHLGFAQGLALLQDVRQRLASSLITPSSHSSITM